MQSRTFAIKEFEMKKKCVKLSSINSQRDLKKKNIFRLIVKNAKKWTFWGRKFCPTDKLMAKKEGPRLGEKP